MLALYHLIDSICEVFLPILYCTTVLAYGLAFFREDEFARQWKGKLLISTVMLHTIYIFTHTLEYRRCMVTTPFEIMSLISFTVAATYWYIETKTQTKNTGLFMIGIAFIFEAISAVMMRDVAEPNYLLKDLTVGIHITAAIFGFSAITISAVYGMLYLLLYREIKVSRFGMTYRQLPSLESLEKLSTYATTVGFFFLSIAIALGLFALPRIFNNFSYYDPKLIVTIIIWAIYGAVLLAHFIGHIEGRRIMMLTLSGFFIALFSMTIINAFLSDFHKFY